jgi:hypothetical protein
MRTFGFALAALIAGLGFLSSVVVHTTQSDSWLMQPVPNWVLLTGVLVLLALGLGVIAVSKLGSLGYSMRALRRPRRPRRDPNPPTAPLPVPPETAPEVHRADPPKASGF